jgi:hypothetical protein
MRPKDPILVFVFHGAIALIAGTVGSLLGAAWNTADVVGVDFAVALLDRARQLEADRIRL